MMQNLGTFQVKRYMSRNKNEMTWPFCGTLWLEGDIEVEGEEGRKQDVKNLHGLIKSLSFIPKVMGYIRFLFYSVKNGSEEIKAMGQ